MKKILICLSLTLLSLTLTNAQNVIRGRVMDENGLPIPGARVLAKGGTESVLSDFDGFYRIIVSGEVNKLVVDYVGYNTEVVRIDEAQEIVMKKSNIWNELQKNNWFVSFQMAFPEVENKQPSYGGMVGWCRNFGAYAKFVTRSQKEDVHNSRSSYYYDQWTTGEYKSSYKAFTMGAIMRLKSPFHIYLGMGVDRRDVIYEVVGKGYYRYDSKGYNQEQFAFDVGAIFKIRYFAVNAGIMWAPVRYGVVGNFGVGVSF